MPKLTIKLESSVRVHLMSDKEDWEKWRGFFADNIGESRAIRLLMQDRLQRIETKPEQEGLFANA